MAYQERNDRTGLMNRHRVCIPQRSGSSPLNSRATVVALGTRKHPQEVPSLIFYPVEIVNNKRGVSREQEQTEHSERGRERERGQLSPECQPRLLSHF